MAVTLSVAARGKIIISFPGYKVIHRPKMRAAKKARVLHEKVDCVSMECTGFLTLAGQ
jgi:hypothetical protein